MFKIIILPNILKCPFGKVLKFYKTTNLSLCQMLLKNSISIKNYCGGFGKCTSCMVTINEGVKYEINLDSIKFNYFLSCQIRNFNNLIITI